ncbi:Ger(x)C family spore germination protein [Lysinibacillus sp. SGAir0095]|uniref:Ger(x)C family spore germination protein n=1 Tax=Lysinibacillus sp. SGAir0095 TaxID=2070463 RepID=UPI0010CD1C74|nr:Ger(x)C family spore germination protein [Lysinibacillus sp. SGAir0095]QCR33444.1 hypothetical protein C1N55_15380 [Lysinibacillus sp. SGAir0095]
MKKCNLILVCFLVLLLTGCWDQSPLTNKRLVNGISFDLTEDNQILGTVRALDIQKKGTAQFEINDELVTAKRPALAGIAIDLNSKTGGQIDASKAHVILIGADLAKQGVLPFLEFFYGDEESYMASKFIITEGKANALLSLEPGKSPIAFEILNELKSGEEATLIPKETIFTTWTKVVDSGMDPIIPYLKINESNVAEISGVALFDGDKYTGVNFSREESNLLLLLLGKLNKENNTVVKLEQGNKNRYISLKADKVKRDIKLAVDSDTNAIVYNLNLKLKVSIDFDSYVHDRKDKIDINKLNEEISSKLTEQAKQISMSLLETNCDAFGIGRELAASYPELWKEIEWKKEYKNIKINPKIDVEIIKTGPVY